MCIFIHPLGLELGVDDLLLAVQPVVAGQHVGHPAAQGEQGQALAAEERKDYKTTLQEVVQRRSGQVLTYHMISQSGPDHDKTFLFEVRLNGRTVGQGAGHSKKEAEQAAAKDALENGGEL